ncbi:uncharacterized protein G6M90_00g003370 [Metarhizium brunneum]|uniref:Uncharacterized protein n=2 Tax=Metarhizium TaxID=5529 RepID=A0A0D9P3L3_METAN|nr:hypothetical protein MANI_014580 [Metarhizium anisopliae]KJK80676.1 hypothetical protein H634G_03825 [Metarhizium anisopliae BRIP 53293]KJK93852.1 hypothetical protein H633G_02234 [Metarhizium anisopliae BRIP 53284]QLI65194.1 hypothetical protein G6M90_00g003370 [Metarhizium brunneum]
MSAPVRAVATARFRKPLLGLMFGTSALGVATYVRSQLVTNSNTMDRFFATYNTPESEASRQKTFQGHPDPRTNILNFLSWK